VDRNSEQGSESRSRRRFQDEIKAALAAGRSHSEGAALAGGWARMVSRHVEDQALAADLRADRASQLSSSSLSSGVQLQPVTLGRFLGTRAPKRNRRSDPVQVHARPTKGKPDGCPRRK
jgi:hypothetical protein